LNAPLLLLIRILRIKIIPISEKQQMAENTEFPDIREIQYNSEDYRQELELRDKVLRKPLGLSLYDENLEKESNDVHIGAFINHKLVGVLILTKLNSNEIKMRQVAVDETWRDKKIGTEMVKYAETHSHNHGYTTMLLNARKTAIGFYESLGYQKVGEEFLEINIPHSKMNKCV